LPGRAAASEPAAGWAADVGFGRHRWEAFEVDAQGGTVFLLDVDNTLLDNDRVSDDLRAHLDRRFGEQRRRRYWQLFEQLRAELGYADYLGALQRFRAAYPHDSRLLEMSFYLLDYPFAERLYPAALEVVAHLREIGRVAILTDGDVVFQPHKIRRSGLWQATEGEVLVYVHKERELDEVERRYPAGRYVLVDDKLRILTVVKDSWGDRVTTVFPRQGHYATDPQILARYPAADISLDRIGDLLELDLEKLVGKPSPGKRL
jgi:FMN phosphatase YigB (HAD superfamily)